MTIFLKNLMKWVKNSVIRFMFSEMENAQKVLCLWIEKEIYIMEINEPFESCEIFFWTICFNLLLPFNFIDFGEVFYIFTHIRQNLYFFVAILFLLC